MSPTAKLEFTRTSLVKEPVNKDTSRVASILGAFGSTRKSFREIPIGAIIHDLDLYAFPSRNLNNKELMLY